MKRIILPLLILALHNGSPSGNLERSQPKLSETENEISIPLWHLNQMLSLNYQWFLINENGKVVQNINPFWANTARYFENTYSLTIEDNPYKITGMRLEGNNTNAANIILWLQTHDGLAWQLHGDYNISDGSLTNAILLAQSHTIVLR